MKKFKCPACDGVLEVPELEEGEEAAAFVCGSCGEALWAVSFEMGRIEIIEDSHYDPTSEQCNDGGTREDE